MAQFLIRDVPEPIAAALKKRAKQNGRSTEAELRVILDETLKPKSKDFWAEADRLREELRAKGYSFDSTELVRQDRDSR
jgi:plasmid stability protein